MNLSVNFIYSFYPGLLEISLVLFLPPSCNYLHVLCLLWSLRSESGNPAQTGQSPGVFTMFCRGWGGVPSRRAASVSPACAVGLQCSLAKPLPSGPSEPVHLCVSKCFPSRVNDVTSHSEHLSMLDSDPGALWDISGCLRHFQFQLPAWGTQPGSRFSPA